MPNIQDPTAATGSNFTQLVKYILEKVLVNLLHHRQYCILLEQEQRKAYKPSLHWGRVHPDSTRSPVVTTSEVRDVFPRPSQTAPIELIFGGV